VSRLAVESAILGPLRNDLLASDRVARMAKDMQKMYSERVRSIQARATEAPTELAALDGRIERLRERLKRGDPDMAADDIQAAIDRALTKLHELTNTPPTMKDGARVFAAMPNAAERFRRQIAKGLDGHPTEALEARTFLRSLLGDIWMEPVEDGSLWARLTKCSREALIRAVLLRTTCPEVVQYSS
jgi:hypothetical protein